MQITDNLLKTNFQVILLADDDVDDCFLFTNALNEITSIANINTVHDGEALMDYLFSIEMLPDILFLDLNMPRKNGLTCLAEIMQHKRLSILPVVIVSTARDEKVIDLIYESGAYYYMRKPNQFSILKNLILKALLLLAENNAVQPNRNDFVLSSETK